ncbi:pyridoxamine 5'-phosphate oxidase family protein [Desulfonatronum thioautotrophicum]|uniref:pyridoxamine 5'-phosphate oxidase family protein n=1 Tax=Desulfonatronum thioautotrophicum TaxID=617001 RepID=UPI0005EB2685|nr:pyridoxamine 5'-phosphate oxidase family protein [Desulfonatronum thioautotrophicum]
MHDAIRDLIQSQTICVLATSQDNTPHTSLMGYVPSQDCTTFYLATYRNTHKFANLLANPNVSLLVDNRTAKTGSQRLETMALTVHGHVQILQDPEACQSAAELLRSHLPHLQEFLAGKDIAFIAVHAKDFLLLHGPTEAIFETAKPQQ